MKRLISQLTLATALIGISVTTVALKNRIVISQTLDTNISSTYFQATTVQIEGLAEQGTGVIIQKKGNTYTVLTNRHVVDEDYDKHKLITIDGKEHSIDKIIKSDEADLAFVYFTSKDECDECKVAAIGNSAQLSPGNIIHYGGYPASNSFQMERSYSFYPNEKITNVVPESDIDEDGYALRISGEAWKGLSGSPVFNQNGQLIGIYGKLKFDTNTSQHFIFAIPINTAEQFAITNNVQWTVARNPINSSPANNPYPNVPQSPPKTQPKPPIDIAYQPKQNYIEVDFQKLFNQSFFDQYDRKFVSFTALFFQISDDFWVYDDRISQLEKDKYILATIMPPNMGLQHGLLIDKNKIDDVLKIDYFVLVKIEGYATVRKNEYQSTRMLVEAHRIQVIGNLSF